MTAHNEIAQFLSDIRGICACFIGFHPTHICENGNLKQWHVSCEAHDIPTAANDAGRLKLKLQLIDCLLSEVIRG